jgi:superfamily II DNA or RNA helicase
MVKVVFAHEITANGIWIRLEEKAVLGRPHRLPVDIWPHRTTGALLNAVGRLLDWTDDEGVVPDDEGILLPHDRVAGLDTPTAAFLGLPPPVPFVLNVQGRDGTIDEETFSFRLTWLELTGQVALGVDREGSILSRGSRRFRIPEPIYTLVETFQRFNAETHKDGAERLKAWAKVQDLLQIEGKVGIKAEDYLINTRIAHASAFSLSLKTEGGEFDFDPVLFGPKIASSIVHVDETEDEDQPSEDPISESSQLLPPVQQHFFAANRFLETDRCRDRYALRDGWYVVLDEPVRKALEVVRRAKRADSQTRRAFARNPRSYLREALGDDASDELLEAIFVETAEYSERVLDIGIWEQPVVPWIRRAGDTWLPEEFGLKVGDKTIFLDESEIPELRHKIEEAVAANATTVDWKGEPVPASPRVLEALDALIGEMKPDRKPDERPEKEEKPEGPVVLIIDDHMEHVGARQRVTARGGGPSSSIPVCLKTTLKPHQVEGVKWLQNAWRAGQGGVLLADDMGLGKTLQALTFLAWLRQGIEGRTVRSAPILIVAPTGLLRNWEQEHDLHLHPPGLGTCVRAFGPDLRHLRRSADKEIDVGRSVLDMDQLRDAPWMLTTYETLRDYQHSFAAIRFAAIVFDEIQKTKTPGTVMTHAAKAMNGDFRIGLTGTPVENRLADLWCIVDTLEFGFLGDLKTFSHTYEKDENPEYLVRLKRLLTEPRDGLYPQMLRRMKHDELKGLPKKTAYVKNKPMPETQRSAYSDAIIEAQKKKGPGRMLEALHRLKSVSLHPFHPEQAEYPRYLSESARLDLLFEILDNIKAAGEKALIFVEALEMQPTLAAFIQRRYGLSRQPMIISGSVSGPKRQRRVNEFQASGKGFDAMILSPRAGGVGLTLTAANHVIHLSRWWNPAVEDQCTDRVYRIGQTQPVHVYYLQALHPDFPERSFDEKIHALLERKRILSRDMLMPPVDRERDTQDLYSETVGNQPSDASDNGRSAFEPSDRLTLEDIDAMDPLHFEGWCLRRLRRAGFSVKRTPKSWDCGADGIAQDPESGKSIIIQCKHTQADTSCGESAIHDLLRAKSAYQIQAADLHAVTNANGFTASAQDIARKEGVVLVSRADILSWPNRS